MSDVRADAEQTAEQRIAAPVTAFVQNGVFGALVWDAEGVIKIFGGNLVNNLLMSTSMALYAHYR